MFELRIVVAVRPPVIATFLDPEQLFRRKIGALLPAEQLRPVLRQLIAAVLGGVELSVGRESEADRIPDAGGVALPRAIPLAGLMAEAPDAGALFQFSAWIAALRCRLAILDLTRVRGRAQVDEETPRVDGNRVHRMATFGRQTGHDDLGLSTRNGLVSRESVPDDGAVRFGIELTAVESDASTTLAPPLAGAAEPLYGIGPAVPIGVAQRDQEPTRWNPSSCVVGRAPGVGVDRSTRRGHDVPGGSETFGKDRGGEARGQLELNVSGCPSGPVGRVGRSGGGTATLAAAAAEHSKHARD